MIITMFVTQLSRADGRNIRLHAENGSGTHKLETEGDWDPETFHIGSRITVRIEKA